MKLVMSEENNIPVTEIDKDIEAQIIVGKIRGLFRFNMYFLLIVPGVSIFLTSAARMGPLFFFRSFSDTCIAIN